MATTKPDKQAFLTPLCEWASELESRQVARLTTHHGVTLARGVNERAEHEAFAELTDEAKTSSVSRVALGPVQHRHAAIRVR